MIYTIMVVKRLVSLIVSKGRYIWIDRDYLTSGVTHLARLDSLKERTAEFRDDIWGKVLYIKRIDGPEIVIRMRVAKYHPALLRTALDAAICSARD